MLANSRQTSKPFSRRTQPLRSCTAASNSDLSRAHRFDTSTRDNASSTAARGLYCEPSCASTLSGTSNEVGSFNFTVTATDANSQTGSRAYTLVVGAPTLTMTPPPGTLNAPYGVPFSQTFVVTSLMIVGIPALMILLSMTLPARANRIMNLVVASLYVPVTAFNAVGASWLFFYGLGIALELILLALIVRYAWTWPRRTT